MNDLLLRVRRTPDRLLHPYRRRKALESLRGRPRPTTLLALCHGNICRSPLAAALLARELAALRVEVQSAGLLGFNRPAPAEAIAAAERDPVNESREVFDEVYERIARCVRELGRVLGSGAG